MVIKNVVSRGYKGSGIWGFKGSVNRWYERLNYRGYKWLSISSLKGLISGSRKDLV